MSSGGGGLALVWLGPVKAESVQAFSPAGRFHWGNVNSLCGALGTFLHRPSRNCSNEAKHIAFHPSLSAPILVHVQSFGYGHSQLFVYTDSVVG